MIANAVWHSAGWSMTVPAVKVAAARSMFLLRKRPRYRLTHLSTGAYRTVITDFSSGEDESHHKKNACRILRQVVIFGNVLAAFLGFAAYRLKTGNFG
ncbi:hypothetical protein [Rhizobium sp. M10]|uniref:hypothetical protein n=1 Tax=Rhizobium sp. M10 TaxID=1324586 RepID=UPI0011422D2D|nr:hypothetical protein [Rhizobium sp. M10]